MLLRGQSANQPLLHPDSSGRNIPTWLVDEQDLADIPAVRDNG
jgi:hypothetical protein